MTLTNKWLVIHNQLILLVLVLLSGSDLDGIVMVGVHS